MTAKFMRSGKVLLEDAPERFGDRDNPVEILNWMRRLVEFEDGLTFRELLLCLSPWSSVVDVMVRMDFAAWTHAASQPAPQPSDDPRQRVVRVEVRPYIVVSRDERTRMANVEVDWEVFGVLEQPDEVDGHTFDVIGLDLTHPSVYADLPIVIRKDAEVSDVMAGGGTHPWNEEPAIHATSDGKVKGFMVFPNVVDTVLYGLLGELTVIGSPDDVQEKIGTIVSGAEAFLASGPRGA
ncbi:hypothetical protein OIU34_18835 [Pararhizobium sp. BT-229]|uniref:hypothetical protein n=1 Tax=Pararhizobium sp. BT-229 TaxID=2986923 RepID=UPI0021F7E867|nr:hypothetical protein [Pararhizobium sp. BT-229]MCV9963937.1 hypothetical protein [Pararhizobium sp. BT-229]